MPLAHFESRLLSEIVKKDTKKSLILCSIDDVETM